MDHGEFYDQVYTKRDVDVSGKPSGWIQWKGTTVCIDLHCACGFFGHFDGEFFYDWKCPQCGACYAVGQNVLLIPLTPEQVRHVEEGCGFKTSIGNENPSVTVVVGMPIKV